uniref:beta-mannosidase n=1 Tax=Cacopsylla melanoneura TaxID=428564 RepID=A0A8D9A481_9HEMI
MSGLRCWISLLFLCFASVAMWLAISLLFGTVSVITGSILVVKLDQGNWTVTSENKSISTSATVPGGIYSDLRQGGILKEDILYRDNDIKYRWVSRTGWTYQTEFQVNEKEFLSCENQFLVFHGVDTIATITLNDQELGKTDNMFVRFRFDVKGKLQAKNNLTVFIASPILEAAKISEALDHSVGPACTPGSYNGECHVNMLRKMQASFAWDWGPAFPSVGIWKSVELEAYHIARLRDVLTDITYHGDIQSWQVTLRAIVETGLTHSQTYKAKLTAELMLNNRTLLVDTLVDLVAGKGGEVEVESRLAVPASDVNLWWPNGYGEQPLYQLEVTLASGVELSTKTVKIGFKTLELVQTFVDSKNESKGRNFYFNVNQVPIYAKGSNLVPVDILPEKSNNETTIRNLLVATQEANMNMLRVWGGGVYMSDYFYETCDELGILIWQDMMFACNNYPTTPNFLKSVRAEISQAVRRIQHHACVAVWAGNNEMEGATKQHWYDNGGDEETTFKEYAELYGNTIKPLVLEFDPTRPYLTSSPTNGIETEKSKYYLADNVYSSLYGDTHNYDYSANLWDPAYAPTSRFCSEFGIQALPQLSTLQKVAKADDLKSLSTEFFQSRQHLGGGNSILRSSVSHQFDYDDSTSLEYFAYLSQVYQAGAIKTITEQMRRDKGVLHEDGKGHNMGALYWQLNDVWQAPTWSSIDYNGNWKLLHHFARKFFAPVLLSPVLDPKTHSVQVYLLNDLTRDLTNVTILTECYAWNQTTPSATLTTHLDKVASNSVLRILSKPLTDIVPRTGATAAYYIKVSVLPAHSEVHTARHALIEDNYLYLAPIRESTPFMIDPDVKIKEVTAKKLSGTDLTQYSITLVSQHIAPFTWISIGEAAGKLSDNGFHLMGEKEILFVTSDVRVSREYILNHTRIMNIEQNGTHSHPISFVPSSSSSLSSMTWSLVMTLMVIVHYLTSRH